MRLGNFAAGFIKGNLHALLLVGSVGGGGAGGAAFIILDGLTVDFSILQRQLVFLFAAGIPADNGANRDAVLHVGLGFFLAALVPLNGGALL